MANRKLILRIGIKYKYFFLGVVFTGLTGYYFCLPEQLFNDPTATILMDSDGNLMSASIAKDGQWRFPELSEVPPKFETSIRFFEDEYFYQHIGFNPFSLLRATYQNLKSGRIVSGGSTLTMQTIRLSRKGNSRTFLEKIVEIILATRLELKLSKKEILSKYASHAPFGGNIVGLEAAAWRYYGRSPFQLSWGEAATLAVLPNQPGLIFPGRNQQILKNKRDRLLKKLYHKGILDSLSYELAKSEELPGAPVKLPMDAPHLLTRTLNEGDAGKQIQTTIDGFLQSRTSSVIKKHHHHLKNNDIYNAAAIVIEVATGKTLAYVGNTSIEGSTEYGDDVDVIMAPRSTGSILKPFLYASMLHEGLILPETIVEDVPTYLNGFSPKNFNKQYEGAVKANLALARSLNVPAVKLLQDYSVEKFHLKLQDLGLSTITSSPNHYGLSLILGGAEAKLWDLVSAYGSMARTLNNFQEHAPYHYASQDWKNVWYKKEDEQEGHEPITTKSSKLSASAIWFTFQAMLEVYRPDSESSWELFETSKKVAWKTGTSFGHRDAWAIGLNPKYVVGVWVGNADGEGRPGMTGFSAAAPILFDVFNLLPNSEWFTPPYDELTTTRICRNSGHLAGEFCQKVDSMDIPAVGIRTSVCPYEKLIHLSKTEDLQVTSDCESVTNMRHEAYFVLPPVQEWYFKSKNAFYKTVPPFRADCNQQLKMSTAAMQVIYPPENAQIIIPRELDGTMGKAVFELAHRKASSTIYWHLDDEFLGETKRIHEMGLQPEPGDHTLILIDEEGEMITRNFKIVESR
ncbi:penicillin-binding protein 1C [Flexithrix dorotheae]|uniref:penicillin-binding protein 1C n=1 Tax=Flexithrix dorotheae TaxID=70993 RepID=UPI00037C5348|nr:penicillin-binding protein 1C [Flexithrix dorotheae]